VVVVVMIVVGGGGGGGGYGSDDGFWWVVSARYHYFKAEDTYNAIRVMITCYVWMTGFGNFSFFYIKKDFSTIRVLQVTYRL
jgi:hypothetical protein